MAIIKMDKQIKSKQTKTKINNKKQRQQVWVRMWRNCNIHTLLVGMHKGAPTVENSAKASQRIENRFTV